VLHQHTSKCHSKCDKGTDVLQRIFGRSAVRLEAGLGKEVHDAHHHNRCVLIHATLRGKDEGNHEDQLEQNDDTFEVVVLRVIRLIKHCKQPFHLRVFQLVAPFVQHECEPRGNPDRKNGEHGESYHQHAIPRSIVTLERKVGHQIPSLFVGASFTV
jgi:hypothetical protein